jgi:hypothetical protein
MGIPSHWRDGNASMPPNASQTTVRSNAIAEVQKAS